MTLKEKYLDLLKDYNPDYKNTEAKGCEFIADEFAIGFAEWLGKGMTGRLKNGNWIYNMEIKASTTQELLERYKKK